jgi:hypothetical protein
MTTRRAFLWVLPFLLACGDYGAPDEVVFGELVATQPSASFAVPAGATYYIDPTVKVLNDQVASEVPLPDAIEQAIARNLEALGYVRETRTPPLDNADVGLKMSALVGVTQVYYPGYWCDYWYWYSCYYSWYYAGSYTTGTVILDMGDLHANRDLGQKLPILWSAAMYGVLSDYLSTGGISAAGTQRVVDAINRAFAQSPYLKVQ